MTEHTRHGPCKVTLAAVSAGKSKEGLDDIWIESYRGRGPAGPVTSYTLEMLDDNGVQRTLGEVYGWEDGPDIRSAALLLASAPELYKLLAELAIDVQCAMLWTSPDRRDEALRKISLRLQDIRDSIVVVEKSGEA